MPTKQYGRQVKPFFLRHVDEVKQPLGNDEKPTVPCSRAEEATMQPTGSTALKSAAGFGLVGATADEALIAAIAVGDSSAMQRLYNRHRVRVFRFAVRLVGDATSAEDVVSEAFIEVWRQADRFERRSSVSTWIMSIARFKALSVRRRRQEIEIDEKLAETMADHTATPEQTVLEMDRSAQIRACLTELSPDHREIIDLVYYHDKTIDEVAEIVGVPKNTVKTRMFYARKRLAQLLARYVDFHHLAATAV
jgi:RNA polymerase sigma-70 factor (ECF subfamily)